MEEDQHTHAATQRVATSGNGILLNSTTGKTKDEEEHVKSLASTATTLPIATTVGNSLKRRMRLLSTGAMSLGGGGDEMTPGMVSGGGKPLSRNGKVKVTIFFERAFYNAGGAFMGHLELLCVAKDSVKIGDILVELNGHEEVVRGRARNKVFYKTRMYLQAAGHPSPAVYNNVAPDADGYYPAKKARTLIPFKLKLVSTLPNSFSSSKLGSVYYLLKCYTAIKHHGEKELIVPVRKVVIYEKWSPADFRLSRQTQIESDSCKKIFMGGLGQLKLNCLLLNSLVVAGSFAYVRVDIHNRTKKKVLGINGLLWRHCTVVHAASGDDEALKNVRDAQSRLVAECQFRGDDWKCDPGDDRSVVIAVAIPPDCASLRNTTFLQVAFFVQVALVVPLSRDLTVELPVYVAHPSSCELDDVPMAAAGGLATGGLVAGGLAAGGLEAGGLAAGGLEAGGLEAGGSPAQPAVAPAASPDRQSSHQRMALPVLAEDRLSPDPSAHTHNTTLSIIEHYEGSIDAPAADKADEQPQKALVQQTLDLPQPQDTADPAGPQGGGSLPGLGVVMRDQFEVVAVATTESAPPPPAPVSNGSERGGSGDGVTRESSRSTSRRKLTLRRKQDRQRRTHSAFENYPQMVASSNDSGDHKADEMLSLASGFDGTLPQHSSTSALPHSITQSKYDSVVALSGSAEANAADDSLAFVLKDISRIASPVAGSQSPYGPSPPPSSVASPRPPSLAPAVSFLETTMTEESSLVLTAAESTADEDAKNAANYRHSAPRLGVSGRRRRRPRLPSNVSSGMRTPVSRANGPLEQRINELQQQMQTVMNTIGRDRPVSPLPSPLLPLEPAPPNSHAAAAPVPTTLHLLDL